MLTTEIPRDLVHIPFLCQNSKQNIPNLPNMASDQHCFISHLKFLTCFFLDPTYKQYHIMFVFLGLIYFLIVPRAWSGGTKWGIMIGIYTLGACSVAQSCPTLCNPMDCSPPGSSVHGALQGRTLEWVAMPSSRGSSRPRDRTLISCTAGGFCTHGAPCEASYTHCYV